MIPIWKIHRAIGMGGDQLIPALAGEEVAEGKGEDIRAAEKVLYLAMIEETEPLEGARELLGDLRDRGFRVVLASSAKGNEIDHYLDVLEARDVAHAWTSSTDVEATKPEPDLVLAAIDKVGSGKAVMIGDSTWDCEAAARAGVATVGVLTGGYSEDELRDAGAVVVFESIDELRRRLDDTPLARAAD